MKRLRICTNVAKKVRLYTEGSASPMGTKREGNYAVTAVISTSTIAVSNQKTSFMHPILAQMDAYTSILK